MEPTQIHFHQRNIIYDDAYKSIKPITSVTATGRPQIQGGNEMAKKSTGLNGRE
jgi:hypothetical protein